MLSEFHLTESNTSRWSMVLSIISGKFGISVIKLLTRPPSGAWRHWRLILVLIDYLFYVDTVWASLVSFSLNITMVNVVDPLIWTSIIQMLLTFNLCKSWCVLILFTRLKLLLWLYKAHSSWSGTTHATDGSTTCIITLSTIHSMWFSWVTIVFIDKSLNVTIVIELLHFIASSFLSRSLDYHDMLQAKVCIDNQSLLNIIINAIHCKIYAIDIK